MKNGRKIKLGDTHVTPRNIQEVQASKLGDVPEAPLLHRQKSGHLSTHYILLLYILCVFIGASLLLLLVLFILFAAINGWTPTNFFCKRFTSFLLPRTLYFSLLSFNERSLFLELRLAFIFHLGLCSDLVISLHQGVFRPLVYVGFHQKSCLKKV
jgi:hypothetical protein